MDKLVQLGKYLISKNINSPLRFQKILFFLRYEEIKNNKIENSYFDSEKNFKAWIYGPVNTKTYKLFGDYFSKIDERDPYILTENEIHEIDNKYLDYFEKWNKKTSSELINISHLNKAWKEARLGCAPTDICEQFLKENDLFTTFENGIKY